jgi:hypothetical protein
MGTYRNYFERSVTGWLLRLAAMLAPVPALAQGADEAPPADDAAAFSGDDAQETDLAPPQESEAEPEEAEPESPPGEVEPEGTTVEPDSERNSGETEATTDDLDEKAKAFFGALGVRRLPPEAYPTYKVRGLEGGSLWRTFHGLQWPYVPATGIGLSGFVWVDTGYEKIDRSEDPQQSSTKYLLQEARAALRVTPTYSRGRWFIQGQSEIVVNKDQSLDYPRVVSVDDLWVRVGMWKLWDAQVGRFEAWELYHFGMGMDINTLERRGAEDTIYKVPEIYGTTFTYYRPDGPGNVAVHLYPLDFLRFELLGQLGNDEAGLNTGAFRGAGILDFGFVKIKGGGEYEILKKTDAFPGKEHKRGAGGTAQFIIDPYVEFGGSGAWGITDKLDDQGRVAEAASYTTWSAGGFFNARIVKGVLIGGGGNYTALEDIHKDGDGNVGKFSHIQTFGALQYLLFDQLYIKVVVAWAKGHFAPSFSENPPYNNTMISGRLRLQYDF